MPQIAKIASCPRLGLPRPAWTSSRRCAPGLPPFWLQLVGSAAQLRPPPVQQDPGQLNTSQFLWQQSAYMPKFVQKSANTTCHSVSYRPAASKHDFHGVSRWQPPSDKAEFLPLAVQAWLYYVLCDSDAAARNQSALPWVLPQTPTWWCARQGCWIGCYRCYNCILKAEIDVITLSMPSCCKAGVPPSLSEVLWASHRSQQNTGKLTA